MKLYLIRHGQTNWNVENRLQGDKDIPLNDFGRSKTREVAKELVNKGIETVITSSLQRACETGKIIGEIIGAKKYLEDKRIIERACGTATGEICTEKEEVFLQKGFEKVEPIEVVEHRMEEAIKEYAKQYKNDTILMVSHGTAIGIWKKLIFKCWDIDFNEETGEYTIKGKKQDTHESKECYDSQVPNNSQFFVINIGEEYK